MHGHTIRQLHATHVTSRAGLGLPSCALGVVLAVGAIGHLFATSPLRAQESAINRQRAPRFLLASTSRSEAPRPVDVSRTPMLRRRISVDFQDATIETALKAIAEQSGIEFAYSKSAVPLERRVRFEARDITVAAALTEVLLDEDVDVVFSSEGRAMLVKRPPAPQLGTITGRVTDRVTGQPVVAAQVTVDGTSLGRVTTDDGRYTIPNVPAGSRRVTVRRIGYEPQMEAVTVPDGGSITLDVALGAAATRLNEVVTTVTGAQRRLEVGNAIASINADSIARTAPIRNFSDLLSGRAADVQILNASGVAGAGTRIRIRGLSSVSLTNDPMIIIDGIRVDADPLSLGGVTATQRRISRLNDLNPDEIESIDVIRGASAATLYGTDAANGVVVIKTKRGASTSPQWTVSGETGRSSVPVRFPDNYYAGDHATPSGAARQCLLPDIAAGICTRDSLSTFNPLDNPATSPIRSSISRRLSLQVSGGQPAIRYFLSGQRTTESGPFRMPSAEIQRLTAATGARPRDDQIEPNALERVNLRANTSSRIGPAFDLDVSAGFVSSHLGIPSSDNAPLSMIPNGLMGPGFRNALNGNATYPFGDIMQRINDQDLRRFTGSVNATWRPAPWLDVRANGGGDIGARVDGELQRRNEGPAFSNFRDGRRVVARTTVERYTLDLGATASRDLPAQLHTRTSVGAQYYHDASRSTTATALTLGPGSETVGGGTTRDATEGIVESKTLGLFAEETVSWRDRLFLTGAVRNDNNSAFGRDLDGALYPKASLSCVVSDEPFFPKASALSSVRARLAYGASGVQPTPTAALLFYTPYTATYQGQNLAALRLASLGNPTLKPERSVEFESGLDVGLFGPRVAVELTYYNKTSHDALIQRTIPPSVGAAVSTRFENLGSVRNTGIEAALHLRVLDGARATWVVNLSGSRTRNELVTLGPGIPPIVLGTLKQRHVPGYPIFGFWDRPILGWKDANGDGILTQSEVQVGDSLRYLGSAIPQREASLNSSLELLGRRVRVGVQFDYRGDYVVQNATASGRCQSALNCRAINDPSAPLAEQAKAVVARSAQDGRSLAGYIENGSFMRLRELSLTYLLPPRVLRFVRGRDASVTLSARNVHLWTKYGGMDPESTVNGDDFLIDSGILPQLRYVYLKLTLGL